MLDLVLGRVVVNDEGAVDECKGEVIGEVVRLEATCRQDEGVVPDGVREVVGGADTRRGGVRVEVECILAGSDGGRQGKGRMLRGGREMVSGAQDQESRKGEQQTWRLCVGRSVRRLRLKASNLVHCKENSPGAMCGHFELVLDQTVLGSGALENVLEKLNNDLAAAGSAEL